MRKYASKYGSKIFNGINKTLSVLFNVSFFFLKILIHAWLTILVRIMEHVSEMVGMLNVNVYKDSLELTVRKT